MFDETTDGTPAPAAPVASTDAAPATPAAPADAAPTAKPKAKKATKKVAKKAKAKAVKAVAKHTKGKSNKTLAFVAVASMLAMFGDATRLALLQILAKKATAVGVMADSLSLSQPVVSHHLGLLLGSGMVTKTRAGKSVIYSINADTIKSAKKEIEALV